MQFKMYKKQILFYILPSILFIIVFFMYPFASVLYISIMKWDGITKMAYVGLNNFRYLFSDKIFKVSLINTIRWVLIGTFVHVPLGLAIALILAKKPKGWSVYRNIIFLPNTFSIVALALIWYFMLQPNVGLINQILKTLGFEGERAWLADTHTALISTQLPFILYIGFTMLIFLAQISTIPAEYYEAAEIDGASKLQQDIYITIPLIKRAVGINILFNTAFCLRMIEYPFIMTSGGPAGLTYTLPLYMYNQMTRARNYGITMACGVITLLLGVFIIMLITFLLDYLERRW